MFTKHEQVSMLMQMLGSGEILQHGRHSVMMAGRDSGSRRFINPLRVCSPRRITIKHRQHFTACFANAGKTRGWVNLLRENHYVTGRAVGNHDAALEVGQDGCHLGHASTSRLCLLWHSAYCSITCAPHRRTVAALPSSRLGRLGHGVARLGGMSVCSGDSGIDGVQPESHIATIINDTFDGEFIYGSSKK